MHRFLSGACSVELALVLLQPLVSSDKVLYRGSATFPHRRGHPRPPSAFLILRPVCHWLPTIDPICIRAQDLIARSVVLRASYNEHLIPNTRRGHVRSTVRQRRQGQPLARVQIQCLASTRPCVARENPDALVRQQHRRVRVSSCREIG